MKAAVLLTSVLTLLLVACAGGSKATQSRIELNGDHLRAMVLIRDELGPEYDSFGADPASGPRTNEQLVEESINPDDEALDVANFGILLGHEDTYVSLPNLISRAGVLSLTDGVILYANRDGAAGDLDDSLGDLKRDFSGTSEFGSLQGFKTFKPKVGERSHGEIIRVMTPGSNFGITGVVNITITSVSFQRDRMVGAVVIMSFDAKDLKGETIDLARKLDKRMQAVLRGEQPPSAAPPGTGAVVP
jgi:hypothetical protein